MEKNVTTVVIKCGSLSVTDTEGGASPNKIKNIVEDVVELSRQGLRVVIVSSGAINSGRGHFGGTKPESVSEKQACSAIGQPMLMRAFSEHLNTAKIQCAQVLFTHDDFKSRRRFLNLKNTFNELLKRKVVPIVNENDSVSFQEITVGDNDQLAVMVAELIGASHIVFLSEVEGLLDLNQNVIREIDDSFDFSSIKNHNTSHIGRGGIESKLKAIERLMLSGLSSFLGSYNKENPVLSLLNLESGTIFKANRERKLKSKKKWILSILKQGVSVTIDEGAFIALNSGSSLLPVGIKSFTGSFERGEAVEIIYDSKVVGVGLSEYSCVDCSFFIDNQKLKNRNFVELIHRDNLIVFED